MTTQSRIHNDVPCFPTFRRRARLAVLAALSMTCALASEARAGDPPEPDIADEVRLVVDLDELAQIVETKADVELVFVTEDGMWTRTVVFDVFRDQLLESDGFVEFDGILDPAKLDLVEVGLEFGTPGQDAPTVPDIVIVPPEDDPEPS